jgi:phosphohistidine phosphatase SixA
MKQVYVLRHASKAWLGGISTSGKAKCKALAKRLPKFNLVVSSEVPRCIETAFEITGVPADQDSRANIENNTGTELVNLITELLQGMRDGEFALIISHIPCMPPARKLLQATGAPSSYANLTGFIVNENFGIKEFS